MSPRTPLLIGLANEYELAVILGGLDICLSFNKCHITDTISQRRVGPFLFSKDTAKGIVDNQKDSAPKEHISRCRGSEKPY